MKTIIETSDYLEAIKPFTNGHAFTAYIDPDDVKIGYGCYCLSHPTKPFHQLLLKKIEKNKDQPVSIDVFSNEDSHNEIRVEIMKYEKTKCKHCSGSVLFKKIEQ